MSAEKHDIYWQRDALERMLKQAAGDRTRLIERVKFWIARCSRCKGEGYYTQHTPHGDGDYGPNKDRRDIQCDLCRPDRELLGEIEAPVRRLPE